MLYREIIAVDTKYVNALCEKSVQFSDVKPGGTQINR
jgi:hypothetical protein